MSLTSQSGWFVDSTENKLFCCEYMYNSTDNLAVTDIKQIAGNYIWTIPVNSNEQIGDCKILNGTDGSVYILSTSLGRLFKFNITTQSFKIIVLDDGVSNIAIGPMDENNRAPILVTNYNENTVIVIINDVIKYEVPVGKGPKNIIIDRSGIGYVCNTLDNSLSVINLYKGKFVCYNTISLKASPIDLCIDTFRNLWVICNNNQAYKFVYDLYSASLSYPNQLVQTVISFDTGNSPTSITPDNTGMIYITNYDDGTLTLIDGNSSSYAKTVTLPNGVTHPINIIYKYSFNEQYLQITTDNNTVVVMTPQLSTMFTESTVGEHSTVYAFSTTNKISANGDSTGMKSKQALGYLNGVSLQDNTNMYETIYTLMYQMMELYSRLTALEQNNTTTSE